MSIVMGKAESPSTTSLVSISICSGSINKGAISPPEEIDSDVHFDFVAKLVDCCDPCFTPFRSYQQLDITIKRKIPILTSTVLTLTDFTLDCIMVGVWYSTNLPKIATTLLILLIVNGTAFSIKAKEHYSSNKLPLFVMGLGCFISGVDILTQKSIDQAAYQTFYWGRLLEVFFEAAPGGALQLYYKLTEKTTKSMFDINVISIAFSIVSIGYGMEECVGKFIPTIDRVLVFLFSTSDFLFRVLSAILFLQEYPEMEWSLIPLIYLYELIVWFYAWRSDNLFNMIYGVEKYKLYLIVMAEAIPSVCTSGAYIFHPQFKFTRENFTVLFLIRFVISCGLSAPVLANKNSLYMKFILLSTSSISFLLLWRLRYLLKHEGKNFGMNEDLMVSKLSNKMDEEKEFDMFVLAGCVEKVKDAIIKGVSADKRIAHSQPMLNGRTILSFVSLTGDVEMAKMLIEANADVNLRDGHNGLPLINASYFGQFEVVQVLLNAGAHVNSRSNTGLTPLMTISKQGPVIHMQSVAEDKVAKTTKLLLEAEADVNLTADGKTALQFAREAENATVIDLLTSNISDVNVVTKVFQDTSSL